MKPKSRSKITEAMLPDILKAVDEGHTLEQIVQGLKDKHMISVSTVTVWKRATAEGAIFKPPAQHLSELHKQPEYREKNIERLKEPALAAKRVAATKEFNKNRHLKDPHLGRKLGQASYIARVNRDRGHG